MDGQDPVLTEKHKAILGWGLASFCQQLRLKGKRQRVRRKGKVCAHLSFKPLQGCRDGPARKCLHGCGALVHSTGKGGSLEFDRQPDQLIGKPQIQ